MTLQSVPPSEYRDEDFLIAPGQPAGDDKVKLVINAMRGRFIWAILLALALGGTAGYVGFRSGEKTYRSGVPIRVIPVVPKVLYNDEEKGILPRYESFVETQVALIRSQRVVDLAMQDPKWVKVATDRSADAMLNFMEALSVERRNEIISVFFSDPQPGVAMAGAEAVVSAYRKLYLESDSESESRRLQILQQLQTQHANDLESKRQRLASIMEGYNGQDITRLYDAKFDEWQKLQGMLSGLEVQLKLLEAHAQSDPEEKGELGIDELAVLDPVLSDLLRRQQSAEHHLRTLAIQGVGEDHRVMQIARADLEFLKESLAERVQVLRKVPTQLLGTRAGSAVAYNDPEVVRTQAGKVREMLAVVEEEYRKLGRAHQQAQELRDQIADVQKKLDETKQRIDHLGVEAAISGRISVLSAAERPLEAFTDTRLKFATAGGLGGAALGFGVVVLLALADRRVRSVEDLKMRLSVEDVLGIVPTLPNDLADPDQAAIAAHAVHHIRSMLQLRTQQASSTFTVTSPVSGTGKTSLVLALGSSFASSGARTLLIDCDLVGGGLTRRSKAIAHRKAGQLLCRAGLLTAQQLHEVLAEVKHHHRRIGEVVVERGYATQEQVDQCLLHQIETPMGVVEALAGEPMINCVVASGVPRMWVLPLGDATAHHATSISPTSVRRLLAVAKQHFDVVLIDTGPIPGSIEASIVAAASDHVVMLLSRGEPRPIAEVCLRQLREIGATLAGVVFNRVDSRDMPMYATSRGSSLNSSKLIPSVEAEAMLARIDNVADYGPMARAVVSTVPAGKSRQASDSTMHEQ